MSVVPDREKRSVGAEQRGTARMPTTPARTRKPSATSTVEATHADRDRVAA